MVAREAGGAKVGTFLRPKSGGRLLPGWQAILR
jgi:hypothetical protein